MKSEANTSSKINNQNRFQTEETSSENNFQITLIHIDRMKVTQKRIMHQQNNSRHLQIQKKSIIDPTKILCFSVVKNIDKQKQQGKYFQAKNNNFNVKNIKNNKKIAAFGKKRFKTEYSSFNINQLSPQCEGQNNEKLKTISYTSPINFNMSLTKNEQVNKSISKLVHNQTELKRYSTSQKFVPQIYKKHTQSSSKYYQSKKKIMNYQNKKANYRIKIPQLMHFKQNKQSEDQLYLSQKLNESTSLFKASQDIKQDIQILRKLYKKRAASVELNFLY